MILVIESIVLCALFTIMVYIMSREPIKKLYNYPIYAYIKGNKE